MKYTRKCLASLEEKGYIKTPFYVQGQRGNQKIFIDKFVVTRVTEKGTEIRTLSFANTTDWNDPAYIDKTEDITGKGSEEGSGKGSGNAPSNETERTENRNREKKNPSGDALGQVEKDQKQHQHPNLHASLDRFSGINPNPKTNTVLPREFAHAVGAIEDSPPPVNPKPHKQSPARRTAGDKYVLQDEWRKLMRDVEAPDCATDLLTPTFSDLAGILEDTTDSIPRIIEVARWAMEKSNYWFRKKDGMVRNSTDFRNAYGTMSMQYSNYIKKGTAA